MPEPLNPDGDMKHRLPLTILTLLSLALLLGIYTSGGAPAAARAEQSVPATAPAPEPAPVAFAADPLSQLPMLKQGRTRRATSANPNWRAGQDDWNSVQPGQTLTLAELEGPGVITHLWTTLNSREPGHPRLIRLRIYWDGEEEPSVDCPIGDFFAGGHGMNIPVESLPVRVTSNGRARNCYWPMPFAKSARITLTNEGRRGAAVYFNVDWQSLSSLPEEAAYFHAEYRQSFPTQEGENYVVADIVGRGHYVGTVLSVVALSRAWWGEGDDFFFIDGSDEPVLAGTGLEDYFCDAWGFVQQSGPYYGTPLWEGLNDPPTRTVAYRWHLPDPILFEESLRFEFEHRGVVFGENGSIRSHTGERADDYSSVAFWYQVEPHKPFAPLPDGYARLGYATDAIEAESLIDSVNASAGRVDEEPFIHRGGRSGGDAPAALLQWSPDSDEQTLTLTFETTQPQVTGLLIAYKQSPDGGRYGLTLDGEPLSESLDFFSPNPLISIARIAVDGLEPGTHTLSFTGHGRHDRSVGHALSLDAMLLQTRPRK